MNYALASLFNPPRLRQREPVRGPTQERVFEALQDLGGRATAKELKDGAGISQSQVNEALKALYENGAVTRERIGRALVYTAASKVRVKTIKERIIERLANGDRMSGPELADALGVQRGSFKSTISYIVKHHKEPGLRRELVDGIMIYSRLED